MVGCEWLGVVGVLWWVEWLSGYYDDGDSISLHTQAIIGSIGDLDSPMSPDQKGFTSMVEFLQVRMAEWVGWVGWVGVMHGVVGMRG